MDLPEKRLLRPDEVADFLKVHVKTVYRYRRKGLLCGFRLRSGVLRFESDEIGQFAYTCSRMCTDATESSERKTPPKRAPFEPSRRFAEWVAQFRPSRLARELGVSRSTVHAWVAPKGQRHPPRVDTAMKIVVLSRAEPLRGKKALTIADVLGGEAISDMELHI